MLGNCFVAFQLERTWNGDGTFTYTGNCSATCDSVKEDYTDPNTLWVCCDQYGCNCDGSSLPNGTLDSSFCFYKDRITHGNKCDFIK